jgi:hypothetical protein
MPRAVRSSFHILLGLVGFIAAFGSACRPRAGSSCDHDEANCLGPELMLACENGVLIETACRGRGGCRSSPNHIDCDISHNKTGDRCRLSEQGAAACVDTRRIVVCRAGHYLQVACRGPEGCKKRDGRPYCDSSIGKLGEPCKDEGVQACAADGPVSGRSPSARLPDGHEVVICQSGRFEHALWCRGESGCKSQGGKLDCDLSKAVVGDACPASLEGQHACSLDASGIAICKQGKFASDEKCKSGTRCSSADGQIQCKRGGA